MTLEHLIKLVESKQTEYRPRVSCDSRKLRQGDIFVAIKGTKVDGRDFIGQAVVSGARYVVTDRPTKVASAEVIEVPDPAFALGVLAQAAYDYPSNKLTNLAVTGTNGKTTTTYLARSIIAAAGHKCGLIGTITTDLGGQTDQIAASMTTPDAVELASLSSQMLAAGCDYMVTEASSHAIEQNRLAGIDFKAVAFSNLTGDHLDYHKTMDAYLAAKLKLFEGLSPDSAAIINKDDPVFEKVASAASQAKILFYSLQQSAEITAKIISMDIAGTVYDLEILGKKVPMHQYAVQITVADVRDGACSSSTLKEASSWGKVDTAYEQMVYAEATLALPLLASYAYHQGNWKKRQLKKFNLMLNQKNESAK